MIWKEKSSKNEEEYDSFSHQNGQNHSNPRNEDNFRTGRHMANSTELPGHDHAPTMMSKVRHHMSEIPHENEEEIRWQLEIPETMDEDKVSMTRVMFTSLMT